MEQSGFPTLTVPHDHDLTFEALTRIHTGLKGQFLYRSSLLHWLSLRASPQRRTTEKTRTNGQLSIITLERVRIPFARVPISLSPSPAGIYINCLNSSPLTFGVCAVFYMSSVNQWLSLKTLRDPPLCFSRERERAHSTDLNKYDFASSAMKLKVLIIIIKKLYKLEYILNTNILWNVALFITLDGILYHTHFKWVKSIMGCLQLILSRSSVLSQNNFQILHVLSLSIK